MAAAKVVVSDVVGLGRAGSLVDWEGGGATGQGVEQRAPVAYIRAHCYPFAVKGLRTLVPVQINHPLAIK
jgi:hypothetical protein